MSELGDIPERIDKKRNKNLAPYFSREYCYEIDQDSSVGLANAPDGMLTLSEIYNFGKALVERQIVSYRVLPISGLHFIVGMPGADSVVYFR